MWNKIAVDWLGAAADAVIEIVKALVSALTGG